VLEPVNTPIGQRTASLKPPFSPIQQPMDTQGTQDSLSFPPTDEIGLLRALISKLQGRIASLVEQYYQWKLANIMTIDKDYQMAMEYKRISNEYMKNNARTNFGLTSWAHTDDLYPWKVTPTKKINNELSIRD
jgi:hypothetical protein